MAPTDDEEERLRSAALQNARSILLARQRAEEELRTQSEWLRVTLSSIGDAVVSTDAEARVTFLNTVAESLTGWSQAEAVGRPLAEIFRIINEQTGQPLQNPALRVLRDRTIVGLENHASLIARDGTMRSIDDSAAPIRDEQGKVTGCVLIFRDVSGQRRASRALEQSEARKTAMFESALDCIISIDHEGTIIEFNAAAERTFGHRREDVLGRELAAVIIPPAFRERHRQGLAHYLATGEGPILNSRLELPALHADGSEFPVELTVTRIPVEDPPLFTAYLRDITERKRLDNELRQYAAELSENDRRKNEFLAMLAHELRNPLAPIRNALQIMRLTSGDPKVVAAASEMMERQVGQMVRFVDDLLDVSRISRGIIELRKEMVELASVVNHAVEAVRPAMESASQDLTIASPSEPIHLYADSTRLAQVVSNLLNNASKFTDMGGRIWLTIEHEGEHVVIRVRDSGIGIAAEHIPHIFDMFRQVDTTLERSVSGLGIGLTLVKNLVEMHDGTVVVDSAGVGQGSEFTVRLPITVHASKLPLPQSSVGEATAAPACRILVVDDNRDSVTSLAMLLKLAGHETRTAYDGLEAVEVAAAFNPDVVLLDIGLPKLNGYEACRRIREHAWGKDIIMVALTGWGQEEDRKKSTDAGFNSHVVKPVDFTTLMKLLASLARRKSAS